MQKKNDLSLYNKYTINNINLDEVDKILKDYVTTQTKKFDLYLIICEFKIEFDIKFTTKRETNYLHNINDIITKIKGYLLYWIDYYKLQGYGFRNINELIIKTFSDKCNITDEHYLNQPMHMCERQINKNIAKNPQLINSFDRSKNHPLIRRYSQIPFNN